MLSVYEIIIKYFPSVKWSLNIQISMHFSLHLIVVPLMNTALRNIPFNMILVSSFCYLIIFLPFFWRIRIVHRPPRYPLFQIVCLLPRLSPNKPPSLSRNGGWSSISVFTYIPPCRHACLPHHSTKHRATHKSRYAQAKPMPTNNPMCGSTIPVPLTKLLIMLTNHGG